MWGVTIPTVLPVNDYVCRACPAQVALGPEEYRSSEVRAQVADRLCTACWRERNPPKIASPSIGAFA